MSGMAGGLGFRVEAWEFRSILKVSRVKRTYGGHLLVACLPGVGLGLPGKLGLSLPHASGSWRGARSCTAHRGFFVI